MEVQMTINIRNDRSITIAHIEVKDGFIVEENLKDCYISDIDSNDDGSICYRIDICPPQKLVESLSNETLLDEVRSRMCQ